LRGVLTAMEEFETTSIDGCRQVAPSFARHWIQLSFDVRTRAADKVTSALVSSVLWPTDSEVHASLHAECLVEQNVSELKLGTCCQAYDSYGQPCSAPTGDRASQMLALAATVVGWPGNTLAIHRPSAGDEVPELGEYVKRLVSSKLHGAPVGVGALVRFRKLRSEKAWGDELVFEVTVAVVSSGGAACHQWTSKAQMMGELIIRASDGAFLQLSIEGPVEDKEPLGPEEVRDAEISSRARICNRGKASYRLGWQYMMYVSSHL
jgi:hypothetical protein